MQNLIERHYKNLPKKNLVLQPYREQHSFLKRIRRRLFRLTGAM